MFFYIIIFTFILLIIFLFIFIPIKINIYLDEKLFYFSIFTFLLIKIDSNSTINKLKGKIKIEDIKNTTYDDINIINYIKVDKLFIRCSYDISYKYAYIIYPLTSINSLNEIINFSISDNNKVYMCIKLTLKDIILSFINKRRNKSERTSDK